MLRTLRILTVAGVVAMAAGLVVVVVQSFVETLGDPSLTLEDGYWIGRLPWMEVGVVLAMAGANLALVAGTLASWLAGGWLRRLVSLLPAVVGAFWWFVVLVATPGGAGCPGCAPVGPDPVTLAYSLPLQTVELLLVPAVIAAVVGLTAPRARREPVSPPSPQPGA